MLTDGDYIRQYFGAACCYVETQPVHRSNTKLASCNKEYKSFLL